MAIDAAQVTSAVRSTWVDLADAAGDAAWSTVEADAVALVTGLPIPMMNGVWVTTENPDPAVVARLLDQVRERGAPYCLQGRQSSRAMLAAVARSATLTADEDIPLMVLDNPGSLPTTSPDLSIRRLEPKEYELHTEVAAAGFEAPIEIFSALTAFVRGVPGARIFVGEVEGVPVSTALTLAGNGPGCGVFNVATPPPHRGRGYGSALTAHACRDALTHGAEWVWLQSSTVGFPVYERLGFRVVEEWPLWVSSTH